MNQKNLKRLILAIMLEDSQKNKKITKRLLTSIIREDDNNNVYFQNVESALNELKNENKIYITGTNIIGESIYKIV